MEFSTLFALNENLYCSLKTWISSKFNRQVLGIYFAHEILSHCKKFEEDKTKWKWEYMSVNCWGKNAFTSGPVTGTIFPCGSTEQTIENRNSSCKEKIHSTV